MTTNGYLLRDELKAALGDCGSVHDDAYERAIEAASRQIDEFCHRHFWKTTTPTPRVFSALTPYAVHTDDIATATGLTVEVYATGGVWSELATTAWATEPSVPFNGRPITRLVSYDGAFPTSAVRPQVRVTAVWGWPAVPPQVVQACQMLAIDHYKSKDLTGGVAGFGEFGPVRVASFSAQARALLEHLRLPGVP